MGLHSRKRRACLAECMRTVTNTTELRNARKVAEPVATGSGTNVLRRVLRELDTRATKIICQLYTLFT